MAIRIKHKVLVEAARDTELKRLLWQENATLGEVVIDAFEHHDSETLTVAALGTATITFPHITACRGIVVEVSTDCLLRINGSTDDIPMKISTAANPAKFFLEATISQIEIENESTTAAMTVAYFAWGDLTP